MAERATKDAVKQRSPTPAHANGGPARAGPPHPVIGIQRKAGNAAVQRALAAMRESSPRELAPAVRNSYEQAFGEPLEDVRVHADGSAARAAGLLGADAFTHGHDVFLGRRSAGAATGGPTRLLAHELVHALQSGPAPATASATTLVGPDDPREREASARAGAVAAGSRAGPIVERAGPHEILRQDEPPAGYRAGVDPDVPLIEEQPPDPVEEEIFAAAGIGPLRYRLSLRQPDAFLVPATSTREQIATGLFGDATRTNDFTFVAPSADVSPGTAPEEVGVRVRTPAALLDRPAMLLHAMLDVAVRHDVDWTVSKLSENVISDADESALTSRALEWSQRSDVTDPSGISFFDRYLNGLSAQTLVQPHWYTLTLSETSHTALEWLLIEVAEKSDQIKKAIELRSVAWRGTTGYSLTAAPGAELPRDEVVGRFYWSTGRAAGSGIQLRVLERIADEPTRERAEIATRNAPFLGVRIVVPTGSRWHGYSIFLPMLDPLIPDPTHDPGGRYVWYFPGTILVRADEFQPDYPALGPADQRFRRSLLDQAIRAGSAADTSPLLGLDYDVLAQATLPERISLLNTVLFAHEHGDEAFELAARIVQSVPDGEFPQFERLFTTSGLLNRVLVWNHPGKVSLGRAFTLKVLTSMPFGADALARMETLRLGKDTDDLRHIADTAVETAPSRLVAPGDWGMTQTAQIGAEPTAPGEAPGPIDRPVLRFKPVEHEIGVYIRSWTQLPPSRQLLPTELVRLEIVGAEPQTRIASAFEVALIASIPDMSVFPEAFFAAVNAVLWARAGIGITKAFGPAIAGGLASGGVVAALRGIATVAATAAGRQALRAFLVDVLILGSMTAVDHYRAELQRTPAGRAFLELYDVVMVALLVRDVHRLLSSGVLTELAAKGIAALRSVGPGARAGLAATMDNLEAAATAWRRSREGRELVEVVSPEGFKSWRPRDERRFRHHFFTARAELSAARIAGGFGGSARTVAERVFGTFQGLAKDNEAVAEAFSAVARRAERMTGAAAEKYLVGVERVLSTQRRPMNALAGFIRGSARVAAPTAYIAEVERLLARTAVSNDAIVELGAKAGTGQIDVAWLNGTKLTDEDLSFLGADARTPWKLFQSAASHPEEMRWVGGRIRGIAAEMATGDARRLVAGYRVTGRQVEMRTSEIDFGLISVDGVGRRRGMEVKGWIPRTWRKALDAFQKVARGVRTSKAERKLAEKVEHMLGQLQDARAATRNPPVLVVTDKLKGPLRDQLNDVLRANAPRGTEVVTISEAEIKAIGRRLTTALGLR